MNLNSQSISFKKLSRIPKRLQQDREIFRLLKNWREVLQAKFSGANMPDLYFRNGMVLHTPLEFDLAFLFHEVWLDKIYDQKGYEISETDLVIDIGANIGVFTLYAALKAKKGKILAFEPFPANADFLQRNVRESKLDNVKAFQKAVAGASEMRRLTVSEEWIKHSLKTEMVGSKTTNSIDIQCVTLDEVLQDEKVCDLLKVDCEGSEYEILYMSSSKTIKKIRRIVGEYHEVDENEMSGKSLRKFLKKNGFEITCFYSLDENSGVFSAKQSY